jgi:hypothetical protein
VRGRQASAVRSCWERTFFVAVGGRLVIFARAETSFRKKPFASVMIARESTLHRPWVGGAVDVRRPLRAVAAVEADR